jgi:hypothetical protein
MPSRVFRSVSVSAALVGVLALVGCTTESTPHIDATVTTVQPDAGTTVVADADASARSIATSRLLFASSPAVVVAPAGDDEAALLSAQVAVGLGVPLLLDAAGAAETPDPTETPESTETPETPDAPDAPESTGTPATTDAPASSALGEELDRLGVATVVAVGAVDTEAFGDLAVVPSDPDADALRDATGVDVTDDSDSLSVAGIAALAAPTPTETTPSRSGDDASLDPLPVPAEPIDDTIALSTDAPGDSAAVATARAAGVPATVLPADAADPQGSTAAIGALHEAGATSTLLLGEAFAALPDPDYAVRAAAGGAELPGGGQHLFGDRLYVALYGAPEVPVLGVLGEQDVPATIDRAKKTAVEYASLTDRTVVPTLEVIATVAAGDAGDDGNFSNELPGARLEPYIDAAAEAGVYVVIDLQPGRTDFLTQAKLYEDLLAKPNVGLALDPEWRLGPNEKHLTQIGSVSASEINEVSDWLAELVNREGLPPKMLVLHQFRLDMITDRQDVDMSHPELELLIHADGQGGQPDKQATWRALHADAPEGMAWGWKNFYDEDVPMLTPEQTMRDVTPEVDLVTYQ